MTEAEYRFEERAAIMEYDGKATREQAEKWAAYETALVVRRLKRDGVEVDQ